mmetsp:Transcript_65618/g.77710  ORF Transcript_65618/g.77710 Transcript_65618/m.77710 type:complete len:220 (+) Transcript_65618:174-833(+)|eukprot:CAMPEP_0172494552 /NCGR_PEP_ID=MMETSP1066-20121228/51202_1 /TAXON_ID=671091 /ORGANISM="Coscinodiscus wailesii, Strain CCMP2513" /LENGTH=219 /DNA_ID=CAMNT_0013265617 /DNA_START=130 /DNA_END=789 /DNA_ORIENTATION=+
MRNRGRIDPIWCFVAISLVIVSAATGLSPHQYTRHCTTTSSLSRHAPFVVKRGGATPDILSESEEEYDDDMLLDDDDSELSEEETTPLASSLKNKSSGASISLASSVKNKTTQKSKSAVNASLHSSQPRKRQSSRLLKKIPYIIRACLNPFTVLSMTRAYFVSLFDIGYLEKDASQTLRSALEEKAKRDFASGKGPKKGKRAMKPGQAKTLSDLPQLSA